MRTIKQRGRRVLSLILIALVIGGIGALIQVTSTLANHCAGTACTEDVANTKHNLAANQDILASDSSTGRVEVCVFCHTPHGANLAAPGDAPLWNRLLPKGEGGNFNAYTSPNFDALGQSPGTPKGVSLACLSCHDGVIAFDALINAPGSGGFQSGNKGDFVGNKDQRVGVDLTNITFSNPDGVDTFESFKEGNRPSSTAGGGFHGGLDDFVNPTAGFGMDPFPNLGRDIRDDHPISMRMPNGNEDPQFDQAIRGLEFPGTARNIAGVKRADTGQKMPVDKRDWVRLYITDPTATEPRYVECASCHNPHTPRTTFLRLPSITTGNANGTETPVTGANNNLNHIPNQGSLLCLTCHQK